jgi:hypothetical protein
LSGCIIDGETRDGMGEGEVFTKGREATSGELMLKGQASEDGG